MRPLFLILMLSVALSAAACGKRGTLEPPEGEKREYPRVYPPR